LAVAVTIVFSWLLYYIVHRKFKFKSRGIWLTYAIVALIITTGISYRLLPVSSTSSIRHYSDLKGVPTAYWQLKTGSHIAYYKMHADGGVAKKKYPILFLHGGPGAYVRQLDSPSRVMMYIYMIRWVRVAAAFCRCLSIPISETSGTHRPYLTLLARINILWLPNRMDALYWPTWLRTRFQA
jgi:hypothetical protein